MEDELWKPLYQLIRAEDNRRYRKKGVRFSDAWILLVFFWAVLHDRPICWATCPDHWPADRRRASLPSPSTMSRRMRTLSVVTLLTQVWLRLSELCGPALVRMIPLLGSEGYLLGDSLYDSNPLHELSDGCGLQLLAPRKRPGTQLGHGDHEPSRLRSIELLETRPAMKSLANDLRSFGPSLYACRTGIERQFGHMGNFGGGLSPLPNWVRRPRRVAAWVAAKLILNGLRICHNQGLTL